jgi:hypothetical protein
MALCEDFESTQASLLHRHPVPSLDSALAELMFKETRLSSTNIHLSESNYSRLAIAFFFLVRQISYKSNVRNHIFIFSKLI